MNGNLRIGHDIARQGAGGGPGSAKIVLRGLRDDPAADWPPVDEEALWAIHLDGDRYKVDNVPFFARDVSLGDVVRAEQRAGAALPVVTAVEERGGHSTYRIIVEERLDGSKQDDFRALMETLREFGCDVEIASPRFIAIDVPPPVNLHAVYDVLKLGDEARIWDFEEGHAFFADT